jgi:hypothetical protein
MEFARIRPGRARRAHPVLVVEFLRRLTEGDKLWGTVDVSPANRSMWRRVRLTVYPPGTTGAERRALHFAHTWPVGGAILCLVLLVTVGSAWPPVFSVAAFTVLYVAGFWFGARLTRQLRDRIRSLAVVSVYVHGELEEYGDGSLLREATAAFEELDARRRAGELEPVRYEAEWAKIYETLPSRDAVVRA